MVHRIVWRVGSRGGARLLGRAARGARRSRPSATTGVLRFADPEGLGHELVVVETPDEPLIADHPEIPAELALQGFDGARAYCADPEASRALLEEALGFEPLGGDGWEARGESRGGSGPTTSRRPSAGSRAPAASTTSPGPRRSTSTRPGASA